MKKTLLFAAVASMTLAACSQNESTEIPGVSDDTKSINFVTSTGTTRANDTDLDALKLHGVIVYGMKKVDTDAPELLFAKPDGSSSSNRYKWADSAWGWESPDAVDKKWPTASDAYPLQFFSAFPDRSDIHYKWNPNYDKPYTEQDWTLEVGDNYLNIEQTGSNQDDYMVALSDELTTVPTNGMAELNFKHIMSNILFSIVTPQNYKVYIKELKLKNIGGVAGDALYRVFDKDPLKRCVWEEVAAGNRTASYSYFSTTYAGSPKATVTGVAGNAPVRIYSDPTDETSKKISPKLMPQKNTNSWSKVAFKTLYDAWVANGKDPLKYQTDVLDATVGAYIEVTYAMVDDKGFCVVGMIPGTKAHNPDAGDVNITLTRYVTVAFPLDFATTAWEQGKKYMYNLRLGMPDSSNGVITDPNYKDENGTGTDIPVDIPSTAKPGEDVTNTDRQIDFTVGISDWADGTGTDIK